MITPSTRRTLARVVFPLYALLLVTATHWPNLTFNGPVPRTDLWIHILAFGTWATLFALTEYTGHSNRQRSLNLAWLVAVLYATLDETTQGLPGIHRTVAFDDWLGNALGITLAWGVLSILARRGRRAPLS